MATPSPDLDTDFPRSPRKEAVFEGVAHQHDWVAEGEPPGNGGLTRFRLASQAVSSDGLQSFAVGQDDDEMNGSNQQHTQALIEGWVHSTRQ